MIRFVFTNFITLAKFKQIRGMVVTVRKILGQYLKYLCTREERSVKFLNRDNSGLDEGIGDIPCCWLVWVGAR